MKNVLATLGSADFWIRLVYILLFALAWQVAEVLLVCLVILQIAARLLTGRADERLAGFGAGLSDYARQIGRYVTGAAEQKPWPFMEWPRATVGSGEPVGKSEPAAAAPAAGSEPVQP